METIEKCNYNELKKIETSKWSINYMIANSLTTALLFGFSISSINPVKNIISIEFNWCEPNFYLNDYGKTFECYNSTLKGSFITTGILIGAVIGSIIGGKLVAYGRRSALIICHITFLVGNIYSCLSEGVLTLTSSRVILGIAIGICAFATPCYVSEMTPKHSRGYYGTFFQLSITIGILIANFMGIAIGKIPSTFLELEQTPIDIFQKIWWRFLLGIPALVNIISIVLYIYVFDLETPHIMMLKKQYEECAALLRTINNKENVEDEYNIILSAVLNSKSTKNTSTPIYKSLFTSYYSPVICIGIFLSAFQQFSGINLLVTNSNRLFASAGINIQYQQYFSFLLSFINFIMTVPTIFFIDKFGRRTFLLLSIQGMAIGLIPAFVCNLIDPYAKYTDITSIISTYIFMISYSIGFGPILFIYLHEIFPIEIKESASSFCMAINWFCAILIVAPSDYLLRNNSLIVFCILCATNIIALIFIFIFIRETKCTSIDESPYFKGKEISRYSLLQIEKNNEKDFYLKLKC